MQLRPVASLMSPMRYSVETVIRVSAIVLLTGPSVGAQQTGVRTHWWLAVPDSSTTSCQRRDSLRPGSVDRFWADSGANPRAYLFTEGDPERPWAQPVREIQAFYDGAGRPLLLFVHATHPRDNENATNDLAFVDFVRLGFPDGTRGFAGYDSTGTHPMPGDRAVTKVVDLTKAELDSAYALATELWKRRCREN